MKLLTSFGAAGLRAASLVLYSGLLLLATSVPACETAARKLGLSPQLCPGAADLAAGAMICFALALALLAGLVLPLSWRGALGKMGNVSEDVAIHGFNLATGVRDLWFALRREALLVAACGLIVCAFSSGGFDELVATQAHLKILAASLSLILAAALLRPVFDLAPHAALWLHRRHHHS